MIRYSLNLEPEPLHQLVKTGDKICLLGSCFTEHLAKRLNAFHFDTLLNPNGIVFNPVSLAEPVIRMLNGQSYSDNDLVSVQNKWVSLFHHGKYSGANKESCLQIINQQQHAFESFISTADWLMITLGTAWVYEYSENHTIVANCHKIPQTRFTKRCLKIEEIVQVWTEAINGLKKINPTLKILFTVSPVKHLRDGVHENNLSKSILLLAVEHLLAGDVFYFPAYELVLDDLRDYRFYDADGAHPNEMAIDYVFEKFRRSAMTKRSNEIIDALEKYEQLKNHRPFDESEENKMRLNDPLLQMQNELKGQYKELEKVKF